ncbi:MAG: hypothetical protein Kow00128_05650 [Deltaproteobacteria bacterium]
MTVLVRRILTAAVLVPLLAAAVLSGSPWPFPLLVGGAVLLCAVEYSAMFFAPRLERTMSASSALLAYAAGILLPRPLVLPATLLCAGLAAGSCLGGGGSGREKRRAAALAALGALYLGAVPAAWVWTVRLPDGRYWVLLGLAAIAAGDTAAYFTGKAFGRRPLAPRVSPNKTVEGALGGLAASLLAGIGIAAALLPAVSRGEAALASVVLGATGQAGDLFESWLKRKAGVKDSGSILPGHGGMFDRADAAIAAGPVLYLAAVLSGMAGGSA